MDAFAEAIQGPKQRREALLEEAAAFDAKEIDPEAEDYLDRVKEGVALQGRIDALVNEYKTAIDDCYSQLSAISNEGIPGDTSTWERIVQDGALTAGTSMAESRKVRIHRAVRRVVVRVAGHDFRLPPHRLKWMTGGRYWDHKSWTSPPPAATGSYATRLRSGLLELVFGPKAGRYGRPYVFSPQLGPRWGVGVESTVTTEIGTSGWGRTVGRGLFAAGIVFTVNSE